MIFYVGINKYLNHFEPEIKSYHITFRWNQWNHAPCHCTGSPNAFCVTLRGLRFQAHSLFRLWTACLGDFLTGYSLELGAHTRNLRWTHPEHGSWSLLHTIAQSLAKRFWGCPHQMGHKTGIPTAFTKHSTSPWRLHQHLRQFSWLRSNQWDINGTIVNFYQPFSVIWD